MAHDADRIGAADEEGCVAGYEGRLELTWTNKGLRLLAHEDGTYEWVPPTDYRVAEVRLLNDVAAVGIQGSLHLTFRTSR